MRCKMLFDNTVLNIIYTGCLKNYTLYYIYKMSKKIYTLSDNMCLIHISATVMLTVICVERMYMQM